MKIPIFRARAHVAMLVFLAILPAHTPVIAWDGTGHKVVTRIAWEQLTPETQKKVHEILTGAPEDCGILNMLTFGLPPGVKEREFFMAVSNWADNLRDELMPVRRRAYNHGTWHYTDYFWESGPNGPVDRPDILPDKENAAERLAILREVARDASRPRGERAIAIAWILHIVGDLHQPLHCSARVTPAEPKGDQGGNLFKLEDKPERAFNLHSYWDSLISRAMPRKNNECEDNYIARVARETQKRYGPATFAAGMKPDAYDEWVRDGFATSKASIYPATLKRLEMPSRQYLNAAWKIAQPRLALAGYRLAELLNRILKEA
ncbi:MAG: S1/P1 nuclease [Blastocatellia bacterium]